MDPGGLLYVIIALVSAVLGALISGKTISYAHYRYAQKQASERDAKQLLNLFQALQTELGAIWGRYLAVVGNELEKAKEPDEVPFTLIFEAGHNYFSVFDNSAQMLGLLDPESCKQIIDTYVNLKSHLDELNNYNRLAQKHRDVRLGANLNLYEVNQIKQQLGSYFDYLKKRHGVVKGSVLLTMDMLKEFLSLSAQARTSVRVNV